MPRRAQMTHTVTERWLRHELIELRERRGWTLAQVAGLTSMHKRTMERIEKGPERISAQNLARLVHVYQPNRQIRDRLHDMHELACVVGWWDDWHDIGLRGSYAEHCELEAIATGVDMNAPTIFHGLVHSPEYADYVQSLSPDPDNRDGWRAKRLVELRIERQRRFWSRKCPVRVLTDETLFLSGRGPLREQTAYVLDLERQGKLEARYIPVTDSLAVPDIFTVVTVGQRQAVCLGGFTEYHTEDEGTRADACNLFDRSWRRALPLRDRNP